MAVNYFHKKLHQIRYDVLNEPLQAFNSEAVTRCVLQKKLFLKIS